MRTPHLPAATREAHILAACGTDWRSVPVIATLTHQTRDAAATYLRALERQGRIEARLETHEEVALRLAVTPHHGFTRRHARRVLLYRTVRQEVAA